MSAWKVAPLRQTFCVILGVFIGVAIGIQWPKWVTPTVSTDWLPTTLPNRAFGLSYTSEVISSDLPLPEILAMSAKVKFTTIPGSGGFTTVGYVIEYQTEHLDKAKVPDRYKHDKKVNVDGMELTALAIDEVTFTMVPHIQLLDKDDFVLDEFDGKEMDLASGAHETVRALASDTVIGESAQRVTHAIVNVRLTACVTCGW